MGKINWGQAAGAGAVGGLGGAPAGGVGAVVGAAGGFLGSVLSDLFSGESTSQPQPSMAIGKKGPVVQFSAPDARVAGERGFNPPSALAERGANYSKEAEQNRRAIEALRKKYKEEEASRIAGGSPSQTGAMLPSSVTRGVSPSVQKHLAMAHDRLRSQYGGV